MEVPEVSRYSGLTAFFRRYGKHRLASRGEVLLATGTLPTGMFYIKTGFVKAYLVNGRGDQHLHMIHGPGEFFPLLYADRRARRGVAYEALVPAQLLEVRPVKLEAALGGNRTLGLELIELAAEQFAASLDRINNLQYRFARERLIDCLLSLAERFGMANGTGYEVMVRVSHQALANKVNLSRESVSREMDRLMRKGLVQVRGGRIVLVDVPGLRAQLPDAASDSTWRLPVMPLTPDMENNGLL